MKKLLLTFLIAFITALGANAKTVTKSITSFSSTSGNIDDNISYAAAKGGGTTQVAVYSNEIRIYKPASGKKLGGEITISAVNECKINSVTISAGKNTAKVNIYLDGSSTATKSDLTFSNKKVSIDGISASSVRFVDVGTDRIDIASIEVTYTTAGGDTPDPKVLGEIMMGSTPVSTEEAYPTTATVKGGEAILFTSANAASISVYTLPYTEGDTPAASEGSPSVTWKAPAAKESEQAVRLKVVSKLGTDIKEAYVTVTVQKKADVGDGFVLITDANNLSDGMEFYIVNKGSSQSDTFVMGAERYKDAEKTESYNNRYAISGATIQDNILTPADGYSLIKLVDTNSIDKNNKKLWNLSVDEGYLCASSSSSNYLNTTDDPTDANAKATISFDNSGNAIITFSGSYTRNTIRKNSNNEIFSCYSSKNQKAVKIYGRQAAPSVKVPGDVTSDPAAVEGVITINKNDEITFSSKDAAKLQVSTQLEPVVGSSYKYTPTEEGKVTITPIDSEGKVYTEKAATFTIKFFKGLVDGTISYKTNTFTYTIGSEATLPELVKEPADVDVEYSISHERVENGVAVYNPATIDEQGNITVNTPGIVTVTATVKADRSKTASYVLEIQSLKEAETSASTVKAPVVHITGGNVYYSPDGEWYWGTEDENHVLSFANETDGAQIYYTMTSATPSSANVRAMANSATRTLYSTPFKKSDLDGNKITFWAEKDDQKSAVETLNFNIKTGIEDIDVENGEAIEEEGDARYFNLQGLEVKNPGEGIYIRVANGKATKILKK